MRESEPVTIAILSCRTFAMENLLSAWSLAAKEGFGWLLGGRSLPRPVPSHRARERRLWRGLVRAEGCLRSRLAAAPRPELMRLRHYCYFPRRLL
jgi:hypothetical protein